MKAVACSVALLVVLASGALASGALASGAPVSGAGAAGPARLADHVVLISVDGLRPEFYLDASWPAPMLQQMRAEGAHARAMRSVFPSVTYPSHAAMVTGALPVRHGIYYNSPFEPTGITGRWYWEAEEIRVPTLWDAARQAGLETASVAWPVSVGAPIDRNLPEIWSLDPAVDGVAAFRAAADPPGLLAEVEREATGRLTPANFALGELAQDDRLGEIGAYLLAAYRPSLTTVHLIGTDHYQHEIGRQGTMVRRALSAADRAVAKMVEAAGRAGILERTTFLITGDHGFVDLHTRLAPNAWLVEAGLMEARPDRGDWRAAFHVTGAAAFLHLADAEDLAAVERVRKILAAQPAGVRRLYRVMEREELARRGAAPEAALALALAPGVNATADAAPPAVRQDSGATHGYPPETPDLETGFVAWGAGIRSGAVAPELRLVDVAPMVAHLLGLEFTAPDGQLPRGLFTTSAAAAAGH